MNKKLIITVVAVLLLGAAGFYFFCNKQATTESQVLSTTTPQVPGTWKTYQNQKLGFSIKYPPQYSIEVSPLPAPLPTGEDWASADFISIFDPKDTSTREFHIIPVHIFLQKQPVNDQGKTYHTAGEYIQSGEFTENGASNPKGELVTVNGEEAVHYKFPMDAEDAPTDGYYFIKDDLIYQVFLKANDPYQEQILQSITFLKDLQK